MEKRCVDCGKKFEIGKINWGHKERRTIINAENVICDKCFKVREKELREGQTSEAQFKFLMESKII